MPKFSHNGYDFRLLSDPDGGTALGRLPEPKSLDVVELEKFSEAVSSAVNELKRLNCPNTYRDIFDMLPDSQYVSVKGEHLLDLTTNLVFTEVPAEDFGEEAPEQFEFIKAFGSLFYR